MPENQNIEWKSKWRDDYLEWICGFANAQGGRIYIGCDDNGHIIGLDNTRKLLEDIPNKVRNAMSIVVDVNRLEEDGKEYHFTDDTGYEDLEAKGSVIEARAYHTYHGIWRYFTVDDGGIDLDPHIFRHLPANGL